MLYRNENVILVKFSTLAALEVVKMTTSSAANDENFIKMRTFPFQSISYFSQKYLFPCSISQPISYMSMLAGPEQGVLIMANLPHLVVIG